jgi:hypothetical protein
VAQSNANIESKLKIFFWMAISITILLATTWFIFLIDEWWKKMKQFETAIVVFVW